MNERNDETGIVLTVEQKQRRRARSVVLALALGALAILFWAVTIMKGSGLLHRPL
ncbi:MAG: CoxF protein [Xanthobacteraceae bacterium]|nr:MAG: CoxF protein [Xanthobacteraceae bacterium]